MNRNQALIWTLSGITVALACPLAHAQAEGPVIEEAADFPPRKFDARRYEKIWARNPFVAEVVEAGPAAPEVEDWAKDLVLRAVNRIEGKYVVHVENTALATEKDPLKARARYQRLVQDAPPAARSHLRIVKVKAHRDPNQVEVTVARAEPDSGSSTGPEAVVRYDPKALMAKAPIPRPVPEPGDARSQNTRRPVVVPTTRTPPEGAPAAGSAPNATPPGRTGGFRGGRGGGGPQGGQVQGGQRGSGANGDGVRRRVVLPPGIPR